MCIAIFIFCKLHDCYFYSKGNNVKGSFFVCCLAFEYCTLHCDSHVAMCNFYNVHVINLQTAKPVSEN